MSYAEALEQGESKNFAIVKLFVPVTVSPECFRSSLLWWIWMSSWRPLLIEGIKKCQNHCKSQDGFSIMTSLPIYNWRCVFHADSWNYAEQPYLPIGRDKSESSSIIYPVGSMTIQVAPGPSRDPFLHQPAAGNLHMNQDNYSNYPSSSNMGVPTTQGVDGWPSDQSHSRDFWGQSLNLPIREWNPKIISHTADGMTFGSNSGFFNNDPNNLNTLNNHSNGSPESRGLNNDVSNRNHILPNIGTPPDAGQQMVAKVYTSRHPRPSPNLRFRNVDRVGRSYVSSERYRASSEEGVMVMGDSSVYRSRAIFDQHGDMRLDIDYMNYEELLALGERIGSVNTGLSEGLISKCPTELIYCSSDLVQDEGTCVICLEGYKNMEG
ncbi:RING-type E3 ubiquitin transferase [Salvia divinorum]|uniref:RING-type E3 ubiquitin transferase n=1 Tax=Salvia divinorum TaxID=28513 RepID=A0ABD1GZP1_SALDI